MKLSFRALSHQKLSRHLAWSLLINQECRFEIGSHPLSIFEASLRYGYFYSDQLESNSRLILVAWLNIRYDLDVLNSFRHLHMSMHRNEMGTKNAQKLTTSFAVKI